MPLNSPQRHESNLLALILHLGACVDQSNFRASLALEAAARRYSQYVFANMPKGGSPDWSVAEDWLGSEELESGAAVDTQQREYVAKAMQEKALIMKETRKAREELGRLPRQRDQYPRPIRIGQEWVWLRRSACCCGI